MKNHFTILRRKPDGLSPFIYILKDTQTQTAEEKFLCVNNTQKRIIPKLDLAFNNVKPKDWYFVLD